MAGDRGICEAPQQPLHSGRRKGANPVEPTEC